MTADTAVYAGIAAHNPLDFSAVRPPVLPLFIRIVDTHTAWAWAQWVIATAAWVFLAIVVARTIERPRIRVVAIVLVLAMSLAEPVAVWDKVLLSESLSNSLGIVLLGLAALTVEKPTRRRIALTAIAFLGWAFLRDANAPVGALVLLVVAAATRPRKLGAVLAVTAVVILALDIASLDAGKRWDHPMINIVGRRVLPNTDLRDYFVKRGMPYDDSVKRLTGFSVFQDDFAFLKNRELVDWTRAHGRSTYASYLLTHPEYDVRSPASNGELFADGVWVQYGARPKRVLPGPVQAIAYPPGRTGAIVLFVLGLAGAALTLCRYRRREALVPTAVLLSVPPHLVYVYLADGIEPGRHAVFANLGLRVSALWLLLLAADAIRVASHGSRAPAHPD